MKRTALRRGRRLRARSWQEKRTPERYGPLFETVREFPCWGLKRVLGHRCEGGHTAHHEGRLDAEGLLPCCDGLHAPLENRSTRETRSELLARAGLTEEALAELAAGYVVEGRLLLAVRAGLAY